MSIYPTPMDIYEILPYHYRLDETFPVLRIPVTGPDPFNTLIVVRGMVPVQLYAVADGDLHRSDAVDGYRPVTRRA